MDSPAGDIALQGANACLANAERLLQAAVMLHDTGVYGPSLSLGVLAAEEYAKAMFFCIRSFDVAPDPKSWKKIRSKHPYRHDFIRTFLIMARYSIQLAEPELESLPDVLARLTRDGKGFISFLRRLRVDNPDVYAAFLFWG